MRDNPIYDDTKWSQCTSTINCALNFISLFPLLITYHRRAGPHKTLHSSHAKHTKISCYLIFVNISRHSNNEKNFFILFIDFFCFFYCVYIFPARNQLSLKYFSPHCALFLAHLSIYFELSAYLWISLFKIFNKLYLINLSSLKVLFFPSIASQFSFKLFLFIF